MIRLSEFLIDNRFVRLDSEYQNKHRKDVVEQLRSIGAVRFCDSTPEITHPHEITRSYVENDGVWFFRAQNNRPMAIDPGNKVFVSAEDARSLPRNELSYGDVVITRTGANAGDCALFTETTRAIASSHTFIVRSQSWSHHYLTAFFNSRFGRIQILSSRYGAAQPEVAPYYLGNIWIPPLSSALYEKLELCFTTAREQIEAATNSIDLAEITLLRALGLENWKAPEPLSYVRNSCEAFATGRLDAEHFQPKFADLLNHLEESGASATLNSVLTTNQRGKQPIYAEAGLPVINSKHVLSGEVRLDEDNRKAVFDDKTLLIQIGDVLMNGTGVGTIGRCAPYLHETKAIPDNHVTILRPTAEVDPIYLSLFLNSLAGQMQVAQRLRGSSGQIELYPNDIAQFKIWVAPPVIQANIRHAIEKSFEQKQRAAQLLEAAKRAVEIAIEQSEAEALAYLHDITTSLRVS